MIYCITVYYDVELITIHMQLMATMRYFDRLETELSRDQFQDLVRKVKLAFTSRLRTCASGPALSHVSELALPVRPSVSQ